ncbi:MAG TPA: mechanosensitive ion channel family protein [Gemmatimonadaceae bacterium]|nr:mechanosensitive ion channel family protein [Gemmatimonadaceae bacterium]
MFDRIIEGNTVREWAIALAIFIVLLAVLFAARRLLASRIGKMADRTATDVDNVVAMLARRVHPIVLVLVALAAASLRLSRTDVGKGYVRVVFVAGLIVQAAIWGSDLILFYVRRSRQRQGTTAGADTTIVAMAFLARLSLWTILALLMLQNFGVKVTALIASLGVGGIAVALAAQSVLGDLFAAMAIYLDKPFLIGDFITFDDFAGSVEYVGLRSTRIDSLSGEQIIIANSDLMKSRIHNYKRMAERRVVFQIGVVYDLAADVVAGIPAIIRGAIEAQETVRFDRAHFKGYGDSSLDFEAVYYVLSSDYTLYMNIQQAINLAIYRRFAADGIGFAFPTRTVIMTSVAASDLSGALMSGAPVQAEVARLDSGERQKIEH